ncbi:lysylphosphatidylglycerol synthase transmembrane domain-containing protein [Mariniblastus fucicola]|uniref:lysylphosphatidylglycerol synthase transmembrane domain-containing protein n=1 Tax=Mariniblastus fucicola TaxID=980251 RepID=UPI0012FA168F|nr:lysylphosphatidylglycerol synthase transmembrane domain-containing protein [Mariniblastus fucicola]
MNPKTIVTILKYIASIGLLTYLIYSRRDQFTAFLEQEKNFWWLAAALATMTTAFMFSYLRWQWLANAIRLDLTLGEAIKLGFIGAFFNVVAFGVVGGDSLRAFYAARTKKGRVPEAILSVFIDRAIGLMVMCGFAGLAWQINGYFGNAAETKEQLAIASICNTAGILSLLGAIGLMAFLMFPGIRKFAPFRALTKLPKVGDLIDQGMEAAALYSKNQKAIGMAIVFSIASNLLFATTIWLVSLGVSESPPSFVQHMVIAPIAMVANSIPLPGGVGGMEVALAAMYESYGASSGVIVAICYRLCILFVSLIGWIVWLVGGGDKMRVES